MHVKNPPGSTRIRQRKTGSPLPCQNPGSRRSRHRSQGRTKTLQPKILKEELRKVRAHILDESKGSESWDSKDSEKSENKAEESKDKDISANVEHVEEQEDIGHLELT